MNKQKREKMLYLGWIVQKLGDMIEAGDEKDAKQAKRLQMAFQGARAYFDRVVDTMSQDEKLKLKTDMERKSVQIDYKSSLTFGEKVYGGRIVVSTDEICTLAGYAIDYACAYCDRMPDEQRNCPLRETLIRCNVVEGIDLHRRDRCPYRGLGAQEIVGAADNRLHDRWKAANEKK